MREDFRIITNAEGYRIPHHVIKTLYSQGKAHLGIDDVIAQRLVQAGKAYQPQDTTAAANSFWNFVIFILFVGSIYLSFTQAWYWFIIGFFVSYRFFKANQKGNSQNYVAAGIDDASFYNKLMSVNAWMYKVKPDVLKSLEQWKGSAA